MMTQSIQLDQVPLFLCHCWLDGLARPAGSGLNPVVMSKIPYQKAGADRKRRMRDRWKRNH